MALWRLYYHLVWSTKDRQPLITSALEPILYGYIIGKAVWQGAIVHAIGGMQTHIHVVASILPKLALAEFTKNVKGSSAHHINHGPHRFAFTFGWQRGYGVFSLGAKQLDDAVAYVLHQKEHHTRGNLIDLLERDDHEDDGPVIWHHGSAINSIQVITP